MDDQVKELKELLAQLEKAISIIANTAGDYTQNIVNDALYAVGYYDEEEGEDEIPMEN